MENTVTCLNCEWVGNEEALTLVEFNSIDKSETPTATEIRGLAVNRIAPTPTERGFLNGCPNCLTDAYLSDLIKE